MDDATIIPTSPIISEHSQIADDDQLERESPTKESSISEKKNKHITRSKPNQSKHKNPHKNQAHIYQSTGESRTISSMFDAMKRKLTPDKEADTSRNNQKMQRNEDISES